MAEHLRNLALASLPWHVLASGSSENDSQSAIAGAKSKAENSSIARIEDDIEEVTLSFDDLEDFDLPPGDWDHDLSKVKHIPGLEEEERREIIADWARRSNIRRISFSLPCSPPRSLQGTSPSTDHSDPHSDQEPLEEVKPKRTISSTMSRFLKPFRTRRKPTDEGSQTADQGTRARQRSAAIFPPYPEITLDQEVNPFEAEFSAATKGRRGQ
jgi:hypothetical protein